MRKTPTLATGVAIAAGGLMAAALVTPTLSASADGDDNARSEAAHDTSGAKTVGFTCNGGAQTQMRTLGLFNDTLAVPAGGKAPLPGQIKVKGPKKGKDAVSVIVTAEGGLESNSAGFVEVLVDGKPLKPATFGTPAILLEGTTNTHVVGAAQFCGKIRKGNHNVRIRFVDTGATSGWHLHTAMAHVEVNK